MAIPSNDDYYSRPNLYLSDKDYPDITTFKVGDKVALIVECEVKSLSSSERTDDKGKTTKSYSADLEICGIKRQE
jgi:hypothetical protein